MAIYQEVIDNQKASFDSLRDKRILYDKVEKLFHNQLNDEISNTTKSQVFDPKLSTLTLERAYRVMSQLATGKVKGISKNDQGDVMLKNLVLDKYITPNANAQFDLLTKFRMVDIYSNIYGSFFVLVDWDVKRNGYMGPDMWLLNIRDVFPQVGAISLNDSDRVIVRTWKPLSYFENLVGQKGFKNVSKIVEKLKEKSGSKQNRDSDNKSKREEDQYSNTTEAKKAGFFEVFSQFERDRWVDVCVDAETEFRDIKNPQEDDDLPVKAKYSIPLIDDFMGFGDFERGASMQMVINSNWNLYLDALKKSISPPILLNKDFVASPSSITDMPGAKWLVRGPNINNVAQPINLSPLGTQTFGNTHQVANASLQGLFGTTDTTTPSQIDVTQGKTPEALRLQSARENTRDNADRYFMEVFVTEVYRKFVNLMNKKQSSQIAVRMFKPEIEELARSYPDIREAYDENTGKLTIKKQGKSNLYDYEIVSGSTYANDKKAQQDNLQMILSLYLKSQTPQGNLLVNQLSQDGYDFKFGELFKNIISSMGIQDWDRILVERTEAEQTDQTLQNDAQQFMQAIQQVQGNINQIPPQQPGQPMNGQMQPQQVMMNGQGQAG